MTRFLKLTSQIINIASISRVKVNKNSFEIVLNEKTVDGFGILGSGGIESYNKRIEIKRDDTDDCKTMENFIKNV